MFERRYRGRSRLLMRRAYRDSPMVAMWWTREDADVDVEENQSSIEKVNGMFPSRM